MKKLYILLTTILLCMVISNYPIVKKVAILICNKFSTVPTARDNDELPAAFKALGLEYQPIIWDAPSIDWNAFDAVLVRATWDYIDKSQEFISTLQKIVDNGIPLFNSLQTVTWNSNKNYLTDLAKQGVNVLETCFVKKNKNSNVYALIKDFHYKEYVIKPAISGGAHKTFRVTRDNIQEIYEREYEMDQEILIQPFIPEIVTEGEWELIFFNGTFSHAILATPKSGDFRVQRKHGGTVKAIVPPTDMITQAEHVLSLVPGGIPLYARVDFVRHNHSNYIMELEVIEPSLYLKFSEGSSQRFAQAVCNKVIQL